jgi:hypothetical protein
MELLEMLGSVLLLKLGPELVIPEALPALCTPKQVRQH